MDPLTIAGLGGAAAGAGVNIAAKVAGGLFDIIGLVLTPLVLVLLKLTSFLTLLGGVSLNAAIYYTVTLMAETFTNISAIDTAWGVIRDVANMGFIFVLLWASIQMILGIGKNDPRKLIVNMVIAAILINFSLFFTKFIIDIANLLALTFYHAIAPGAGADFLSGGLSNAIMEPMGITSIWKASGGLANLSNFAVMGIMGSVVLLISAFIFFAIALMLIIRYVVLIFVLILSPIAFVSGVLPGLNRIRDQWQEALIGQAFFAPVYFLLTWIVVVVINGISKATFAAKDFSAALGGSIQTANGVQTISYTSGIVPTFINFTVIIVFLILTLVISKTMAGRAGGIVNKITGSALGFAGGASLGLAGRFGRGTAGRFGQAVADNEKLKAAAPTSRLARLALATGRKTAGSSFDLRGTGLGAPLGGGKAQSGGFAKDMKDKVEAEKKLADTFKPSDLVVAQAEQNVNKYSEGTPERAAAQAKLDELKGLSKKDVDSRKKDVRTEKGKRLDENEDTKKDAELDKEIAAKQKEANETTDAGKRIDLNNEINRLKVEKDITKTKADAARKAIEDEYDKREEAVKETRSAANIRKEAYAKTVESRIGFFGSTNKEDLTAAMEIRKSIKSKSAKDRIAEAASELAKEDAESTVPPVAPATPPGGTPPPTSPPGPAPATP